MGYAQGTPAVGFSTIRRPPPMHNPSMGDCKGESYLSSEEEMLLTLYTRPWVCG